MIDQQIVQVSKVELWFGRGLMGIVTAVLVWVASTLQNTQVQMAEVRKELEITKPSEVLAAVNALDRKVLGKEDIKSIIIENSPWNFASKDWETWKLETEKRLYTLERDINKLKEEANNDK